MRKTSAGIACAILVVLVAGAGLLLGTWDSRPATEISAEFFVESREDKEESFETEPAVHIPEEEAEPVAPPPAASTPPAILLPQPAIDHAALVAEAFAPLEEQRDVILAAWRDGLASLRDEEAVDAFVAEVTGLEAKGQLVVDLVSSESTTPQIWNLLHETIVDHQQLKAQLVESVELFQHVVQATSWDLLAEQGLSDDQIVSVLNAHAVQEMTIPLGPFHDLVSDAMQAAVQDTGRFVANWFASDLISSAVIDLGRYFGVMEEDQGLLNEFALKGGTDFLVGDVLDQVTDFSDSIRRDVRGHLSDVETAWLAELQATLDQILANYRQACEAESH